MKRMRFAKIGVGSWMCGMGVMALATGPAMAGDFSIGALVATGGHGGTVVGGFLRIGEPRPQVVAPPVVIPGPVVVPPPVIVERVWVSTPRIECRQVPVIDAWGRVIAYREERVTIPDGHWETVTRPAPAPCAAAVVVHGREPVRGHEERVEHRDGRGVNDGRRYFAPPPGRLPTAAGLVRSAVPARGR
jgi:hypothetical protein